MIIIVVLSFSASLAIIADQDDIDEFPAGAPLKRGKYSR
jgi:hypothetical protein